MFMEGICELRIEGFNSGWWGEVWSDGNIPTPLQADSVSLLAQGLWKKNRAKGVLGSERGS